MKGEGARVIGLTGGVASGKSTVRRMLEAQGAVVLDADAIYHELLEPTAAGPSKLARAIGELFAGVLREDGRLDREKLGRIVFAESKARARLEHLAHPAVLAKASRKIEELAAAGTSIVIFEVPLFFEAGLEHMIPEVIVVTVPPALQLTRLLARDGCTLEEARARIEAQLPLTEKVRRATWVLDASLELSALERDVRALFDRIIGPAR